MANTDTEVFLNRVIPWNGTETAAGTYINIHWTFKPKDYQPSGLKDKLPLMGMACVSLPEVMAAVQRGNRSNGDSVYVCLSTQTEYMLAERAGGGTWRKSVRSQSNVATLKALWIDIDDKDYDTREDLLLAFASFVVEAGLPPASVVVDTGGGIHAYWTLTTEITREEWTPLAMALKNAVLRFKLKCDVQCTSDSARLMRLPGTFNRKAGREQKLANLLAVLPADYTVEDMTTYLHPYAGAEVIALKPKGMLSGTAPQGGAAQANAELSGGIDTQAPPINLDTVADAGCGFIKSALDTGGADFTQPLWNIATLVATFSDDPQVDAHRMAHGHPGYVVEETQELFERKLAERQARNIGWPSCEAVETAGCSSCATCPLKAPGTRPLQFGRVQRIAVPSPDGMAADTPMGDLPRGYSRRPHDDIIVTSRSDGQGGTVVYEVVPFPLKDAWLQDHPWTIHFSTRLGHTTTLSPVSIQLEHLNSSDTLAKRLGSQGLAITPDQTKQFREFAVAWVNKLRDIKGATISSTPFGWVLEHGKIMGFCYAGRMWGKGSDQPTANPDPVLRMQYKPNGEIDAWKEAAALTSSLNSPERDLIIASAFAAPLVRFTDQYGVVLSAYSKESGIGKSAAMKVAASVWGDPDRSKQGLNDTMNSVAGKVGALRHLPLYWDELRTETDQAKFVQLAFKMSEGKDKSRMSADTSLRMPGTWQTLMICASNDSIQDQVMRQTKTTMAGALRVFEFSVKPVDSPYGQVQFAKVMGKLSDHYGGAGLAYAQFLGAEHEAVATEVTETMGKLEKGLRVDQEERFWLAAITTLYMGAKFANRLGLTSINEDRLLQFLVQTLKVQRRAIRSQPIDLNQTGNVVQILQQFLAEQKGRYTLTTNKMHTGTGRPPAGTIEPRYDTSRLDYPKVHVAEEDRRMRISLAALRDWLTVNAYGHTHVLTALETDLGATTRKSKMAVGTRWAGIDEQVLDIEYAYGNNADYFE